MPWSAGTLLSMYYHTRQNTAFVPASEEQLQKGVMRGSGRGMLISRLGFDEEQVAAFDILRADYHNRRRNSCCSYQTCGPVWSPN